MSLCNLDSNLHNSKTLIMDTCLFKVTYETKHDESSVSERFIWVVSSTFSIVQILDHSHFHLGSWLLALEATELN